MDIKDFILFRKKITEFKKKSFGFEGLFLVESLNDKLLIQSFHISAFREIYNYISQDDVDLEQIQVGEKIKVSIDLSNFPFYYENFEEFLASNKYSLQNMDFYIYELDYQHSSENNEEMIENYLKIQEIISFLMKLSTFDNKKRGLVELFFNKPDKICSISIDYGMNEIANLSIKEPISIIEANVFQSTDSETRAKLFTNEMINFLSEKDYKFSTVLKDWEKIVLSYKNSFQVYLSEFSFEKIKTSSQNYFHELTDRIYSTINKFSAYILAIPVAYILILRFFDFNGQNFAKDSFLVIIGLIYFIIIWFVLLNNLSKAFETIENDITKFIQRIKGESNLNEITESLKIQKSKIIPSQKKKINLVKVLSVVILLMTLAAYLFIYLNKISSLFDKT